MGNKCCSKRQDPETQFSYTSGYKKSDISFTSGVPKQVNGGSIDSRYTPDPNRGQLKAKPSGVDIIRTRPSMYFALELEARDTYAIVRRFSSFRQS